MLLNRFSKAHKCYKKHNTVGISVLGTDRFMKENFYCQDCNKVGVLKYFRPFGARLSYKINCLIHRNDDDWLPF